MGLKWMEAYKLLELYFFFGESKEVVRAMFGHGERVKPAFNRAWCGLQAFKKVHHLEYVGSLTLSCFKEVQQGANPDLAVLCFDRAHPAVVAAMATHADAADLNVAMKVPRAKRVRQAARSRSPLAAPPKMSRRKA